MKRSTAILLTTCIMFIACVKEKKSILPPQVNSPVSPSSPQSVYTQKMNKTWVFDGYNIYAQHPSNRDSASTYADTTIYKGMSEAITVLNDTTITFRNTTYKYSRHDSAKSSLVFVHNSNPYGNPYDGVTYYYKTNSIVYYYHEYGVSFNNVTYLYTK